ncbi:MAG: TIGR01777 family protein [Planctomycetes bacterium]|nr:TIGR01777 family protein [Planctomycetota bacterium]
MRVLVTGATGFLGPFLCSRLLGAGHAVRAVARDLARTAEILGPSVEVVPIPGDAQEWANRIVGCDGIVNLAGASVAKRWTTAHKAEMHSSRVDLTRAMVEGIARLPEGGRPRALVSGSAVGYYGCGDEERNEASPGGSDFLARLCQDWEAEARRGEALGVRVVLLRIGVVLGLEGGALRKMLTPFRLCLGGPIAGGRQWMSWIHRDDLIRLAQLCLENEGIRGAVNACAPGATTNRELAQTLASVLRRPCLLPVPAFVLRLALGEAAEMVARGQRIRPEKALAAGYTFRFPDLRGALENLLATGDAA